MKFVLDGDLVVGKGDGDFEGFEVDPSVADIDLPLLRFDGQDVFNASGVTSWFIDDFGRKHIAAAPGRFAMTAAIDTPIEPDGNGGWRLIDPKGPLLAYARSKRIAVENGGAVWQGLPIYTDAESQRKIIGSRIAADAAPEMFSTVWYGSNGEKRTLDAAGMIDLSNAVFLHISTSFNTFSVVEDGINSGEITSKEEIDTASWPPNG